MHQPPAHPPFQTMRVFEDPLLAPADPGAVSISAFRGMWTLERSADRADGSGANSSGIASACARGAPRFAGIQETAGRADPAHSPFRTEVSDVAADRTQRSVDVTAVAVRRLALLAARQVRPPPPANEVSDQSRRILSADWSRRGTSRWLTRAKKPAWLKNTLTLVLGQHPRNTRPKPTWLAYLHKLVTDCYKPHRGRSPRIACLGSAADRVSEGTGWEPNVTWSCTHGLLD